MSNINDGVKRFNQMPMALSKCCGAVLLDGVQCENCGADDRDNPFNDKEHNELLDEKLNQDFLEQNREEEEDE